MSDLTPPASLVVGALIRQVAAEGGVATVLARGHAQGSALVLVHLARDGGVRAFERVPDWSGTPGWRLAAEGQEAVDRFCARQRSFDPDLWIVELSVPKPERFVAGLPATD